MFLTKVDNYIKYKIKDILEEDGDEEKNNNNKALYWYKNDFILLCQ